MSAMNQEMVRHMVRPQQPVPEVAPVAPEVPPEQDDNVDTTNETDMEEPPILIRRRRRRTMRHPPNIAHLGPLNENVEEEEVEEEDVEQGETVLLFPRLVLERIRLTPTRPSSIGSRRPSAGEEVPNRTPSPVPGTSTATPQQAPDTPRSRESFEDFTRRMGSLDPMEGPSWLFSDDINNGPRQTKSRDEKRKENSLKARFSSASRKLSIEPDNEEEDGLEEEPPLPPETEPEIEPEPEVAPEPEVEPEPEEPRRRGGSRAAAQAARNSLKEPTLGSKLRQGDPVGNSVYNDFVPGTKRKSDRKSSKGSSKKKKSSDGK